MVLMAKPTHRRYAQKKHYQFYDNDRIVGNITIDVAMSEDEILDELVEYADLTGANKIILHWTALDGIVDREVQI